MYYSELEEMKAVIEEHEGKTGNAIYWAVNSQEELDELKPDENNAEYIGAIREYLDDDGVLPCYVVTDGSGYNYDIYDNEEDAVREAYSRI